MPFLQLSSGTTIHLSHLDSKTLQPVVDLTDYTRTALFIHGLGSSQNFYLPLLPYLPRTRCILVDTPGAGRSPLPSNAETSPSTITTFAEILLELLHERTLCLEDVDLTVVGHSMGSLIALHLAQLAPEQVRMIVLIGPVYPTSQLAQMFTDRIKKVRDNGMEVIADTVPHAALGEDATPLMRAMVRELILGQSIEGYAAVCDSITKATIGDLSKVNKKARALIVAGSSDKSAPVEACRMLAQDLDSMGVEARMKILPGCGHWHVIEDAKGVGEVVKDFIDRGE